MSAVQVATGVKAIAKDIMGDFINTEFLKETVTSPLSAFKKTFKKKSTL